MAEFVVGVSATEVHRFKELDAALLATLRAGNVKVAAEFLTGRSGVKAPVGPGIADIGRDERVLLEDVYAGSSDMCNAGRTGTGYTECLITVTDPKQPVCGVVCAQRPPPASVRRARRATVRARARSSATRR